MDRFKSSSDATKLRETYDTIGKHLCSLGENLDQVNTFSVDRKCLSFSSRLSLPAVPEIEKKVRYWYLLSWASTYDL